MNGAKSFIAEMRENANIVSPLASVVANLECGDCRALGLFFGRRMLNRLRMLPKKKLKAPTVAALQMVARSKPSSTNVQGRIREDDVKLRNNTVNSDTPRRATRCEVLLTSKMACSDNRTPQIDGDVAAHAGDSRSPVRRAVSALTMLRRREDDARTT